MHVYFIQKSLNILLTQSLVGAVYICEHLYDCMMTGVLAMIMSFKLLKKLIYCGIPPTTTHNQFKLSNTSGCIQILLSAPFILYLSSFSPLHQKHIHYPICPRTHSKL